MLKENEVLLIIFVISVILLSIIIGITIVVYRFLANPMIVDNPFIPYRKGWKDYLNHKSLEDCPYKNKQMTKAWKQGFIDGFKTNLELNKTNKEDKTAHSSIDE